jgi:hypothetical protein
MQRGGASERPVARAKLFGQPREFFDVLGKLAKAADAARR